MTRDVELELAAERHAAAAAAWASAQQRWEQQSAAQDARIAELEAASSQWQREKSAAEASRPGASLMAGIPSSKEEKLQLTDFFLPVDFGQKLHFFVFLLHHNDATWQNGGELYLAPFIPVPMAFFI